MSFRNFASSFVPLTMLAAVAGTASPAMASDPEKLRLDAGDNVCINASYGKVSKSKQAELYDCDAVTPDNTAQDFLIRPDGRIQIKDLCLHVPNSKDSGTPVLFWDCDANGTVWEHDDDGHFRETRSNLCLGLADNAWGIRSTPLVAVTCQPNEEDSKQTWTQEAWGPITTSGGKCLQAADWSHGSQVDIATCQTEEKDSLHRTVDKQKWHYDSDSKFLIGDHKDWREDASGLCLGAPVGKTDSLHQPEVRYCNPSDKWEKWEVTALGQIKNVGNKMCLELVTASVISDTGMKTETHLGMRTCKS